MIIAGILSLKGKGGFGNKAILGASVQNYPTGTFPTWYPNSRDLFRSGVYPAFEYGVVLVYSIFIVVDDGLVRACMLPHFSQELES